MAMSRVVSAATGRRVVVAMSGGVDSSVAAYLLQQQQQQDDINGLYMSNWDPRDEDDHEEKICNEADYKDCQGVCQQLNIPLHYASFAAEYWTGVFEPYVDSIRKGQMPNPDVGCNSIVKFGAMKDYAQDTLQADFIATGHYARLWHGKHDKDEGINEEPVSELVDTILLQDSDLSSWLPSYHDSAPLLLAGADLTKDQSYFLCRVAGESFHNVLFPLGNYLKNSKDSGKTTRQVAQDAGLNIVSSKRESMGICFVGKRRKFSSFMEQYLPDDGTGGDFVNVDTGEVVGQYKHGGGVHRYVVGQGARIGGASQKWFVAGRYDNTILVCGGTHHPTLYANELYVRDMHWIGGKAPPPPLLQNQSSMRAWCRIRHLQPLIPCQITRDDNNHYAIRFDIPVRAISPGQIAAIYMGPHGEICLGGGPIWDRGPTYFDLGLELPQVLHPAGHNDLSVKKRSQ